MTKVASVISLALHPMVIAPLTFGTLIYTGSSNNGNLNSIFFIAFFFSTILSLFTVIYLKRIGKISDLDASIREQRIEPLVLGTIYHAVGFILLRLSNAAPIVQGLMFCYAFNTAIVWLITRKWKISIHAIGLAGPMMALWLHGFYFPIPMGLALVLVSMSRVILKAHTPIEVTAGVILGMGLTLIELQFLFL
ncbi:MAG: hypothetical protein VYC00_02770 [Candidatus Neomarinimicrobiota bacterium]|nr:hypothetical protein [Candidatus Neomarinimicrobiota bacterium]